jgi:hypothetical protein
MANVDCHLVDTRRRLDLRYLFSLLVVVKVKMGNKAVVCLRVVRLFLE